MSRRARSPRRPRHRNPYLLGAFALLVVASTAAFGVTEAGHVATLQHGQGEFRATVVDLRVATADGEPVVVATAEVRNPSFRAVEVTRIEVEGDLGGTTVVEDRPGLLEARVPARSTAPVEFELSVADGRLEDVRAAVEDGSLSVSGIFWVRVGDHHLSVGVGTAGSAAGMGWSG